MIMQFLNIQKRLYQVLVIQLLMTRLHYKRGWLNYHEINYAYAINDFSIAIKKGKQIDKYHYFMARGFSFIKINNLEKALDDFKNALECNQLAIEFYKDFFLNFVPKRNLRFSCYLFWSESIKMVIKIYKALN